MATSSYNSNLHNCSNFKWPATCTSKTQYHNSASEKYSFTAYVDQGTTVYQLTLGFASKLLLEIFLSKWYSQSPHQNNEVERSNFKADCICVYPSHQKHENF